MNARKIIAFLDFVANHELSPSTPKVKGDLLELHFGCHSGLGGQDWGSVLFHFSIFDEQSSIAPAEDELSYRRYAEILSKGNIDNIYVNFSGAKAGKNFSLLFRNNTIRGEFDNYIEVTKEMIDKAKLACLKQIEMVLDKKKHAQKFQRVG